MIIAEFLVLAAKIWGAIGGLTALVFVPFGIDRIDEDARGAYIFRPLLVPGVILLWPLVLWRWGALEGIGNENRQNAYRPPRGSHGFFACFLALVIVLAIALAFSIRQPALDDYAPERLSAAPAPALAERS